jgi:hypothetical protein
MPRWSQIYLIRQIQPLLRSKCVRPPAVILALLFLEFEKVYTNPADHTELKRERWTASVTYVFRENVKNSELAVNPLGLTIVRFRADQAFS